MHAFRGEADLAFEWLERAYDQREAVTSQRSSTTGSDARHRRRSALQGVSEEAEAAGVSVDGRRGLTLDSTVRASFDSRRQRFHRVR